MVKERSPSTPRQHPSSQLNQELKMNRGRQWELGKRMGELKKMGARNGMLKVMRNNKMPSFTDPGEVDEFLQSLKTKEEEF
ncbi:hypothetical protein NDU88_008249 [Pleurodeles waltl]|uniref:Uncharacterized protein n=1 Tax=Pleurodeles waltl TaxID=8319 RepID=A0AAV7NVE9_PLEWA|nr:hypothetical protein NDU88_008249 [Pleurodeles waltl]